ncbi:MAG: hypothetical protein H8E38_00530 [SAR324 cluster bacterium]|nr:hypothetical protein [SAR324 cluster bacterium]MBL7035674.1 hypothetical protein [SAR324 cluster bacterium]
MLLLAVFSHSAFADAKANYEKKVGVNDATIGVIAGVINYVCPKLVDASLKVCNPKDPVGSAVGVQKVMGDLQELDDMDPDELIEELTDRKILHVDAAMQFFDAVEQFKLHYPLRAAAKESAAKGEWEDAARSEEMAWQYLVKTASRGIFAKKMVDGE